MKLETGIRNSTKKSISLGRPHKRTRRLELMKRLGLFGTDKQGATISRAYMRRDLERAYRLVYKYFLENNYIKPNAYGIRIRKFEACPETATFIAKKEGKVVGVLSLILDSPDLGLPSDISFGQELDLLRMKGKKLCEGTNQAIIPAFRKTAITTEMVRCGTAQGIVEGCDYVIVAVSPTHRSFYELLGFFAISDFKSHSSEVNDPVVIMCLDVEKLKQKDTISNPSQAFGKDFLLVNNPFIQKIRPWNDTASQFFYDAELLGRLFFEKSDLLAKCTDAEREAIQNRWGGELFAEVVADGVVSPEDITGEYIEKKSTRAR